MKRAAMKIGIIRAGHIGGTLTRRLAKFNQLEHHYITFRVVVSSVEQPGTPVYGRVLSTGLTPR